jgi:hypothetical protein
MPAIGNYRCKIKPVQKSKKYKLEKVCKTGLYIHLGASVAACCDVLFIKHANILQIVCWLS